MAKNTIAQRYVLEDSLGQGGMGEVYRALDTVEGRRVALKLLKPSAIAAERSFFQFKQEFRAALSMRHPHLVQVFDFGQDGGAPYFTMELVEGPGLETGAPQPPQDACDVLVQILLALELLHARGVLHRDIKPENVRFTREGEVKILDLGLLEAIGTQRADHFSGTVAYLPPEAFSGQPLTAAADLYSVGVVAYELLSGRHPYGNVPPRALIQAIVHERPAPLAEVAPDVPAPLSALVMRLLAKDPLERPARAGDVIRALAPWLSPRRVEESRQQAYTYLLAPGLVGRRRELAFLLTATQGLAERRGGAVMVGAHPGVGKSRLLQELKLHCQLGDVPFLAVRCTFEGGSPYGLLRQVLQVLMPLAPESVLQQHKPLLAALLPSHGGAWLPLATQDKAEFHAQVAAFIAAVADARPMVLFADDLQWADTLSLEAMAYCLDAHKHTPVLWLGTYRLNEVGPRHLVSQVLQEGTASGLAIAPFELTEIAELVMAMLGTGELPAGLLPLLRESTGGNGFFLTEMLRYLVDQAYLRHVDGTWRFSLPEGMVGLPSSLERLIAQRVARLSAPAQALARLGAVWADEVSARELAILELPDETLLDAINDLIAHQVWVRGEDGYRFVHERLRESIYLELPAPDRRRLHQTIAERIEGQGASAANLAYHFSHGEDLPKAVRYLRQAGCEAEAAGAMHEAFRHWHQAAQLLEAHPGWGQEALLVELWLDLGNKCGFSVDSRVGEEALDKALAVLTRLGKPELAARAMGLGLRLIHRLPGALSRPILDKLSQPVPFRMPTGWRKRLPPNYLALIPLLIESYTYLTICCNTNGKIGKALEVNRAGQKLVPDRGSWAWGVVMTAYAYSLVLEGRFDESVRIAREAFRLLKDETALQAIDLSCGALVLANNQVYQGAPIDPELAAELLKRSSAHHMTEWEGMVQYAPMVHHALTGRARQAIAAIETARPFSKRCGRGTVLERELALATARIRAVLGEFEEALRAIEAGIGLDQIVALPYFTTRFFEIRGRVHLERDDLDAAAADFHEVIGRENAYGLKFTLPEAHLGLSEVARRQGDLPAAEAYWRQAAAIVDDPAYACDIKRIYLERQRGKLEEASGRWAQARAAFERALAHAEAQDNPWQAALVLTDLGHLAVRLDQAGEARRVWELALARYQETDNARGVTQLRALLATVAGQASASSARQELERLAVLQRFGEAVAGARTVDAVLDTLLTHAMEAVGGERGAILRVWPHKVEPVLGREHGTTRFGEGPTVSHTVVREAVAAGAPQLVTDALEDALLAHQNSVSSQSLRTVIGVPLGDEADDLVLYADRRTLLDGGLDQGHVWALQSLVHFGRVALNHARLLEQSQARAERLQMLNHVSLLVSSSLELDRMLERLLDWVLQLTGGEVALVISTGADRGILGARGTGSRAHSRTVVEQVVESRQPLCVLDSEAEPADWSQSVQALKLKSIMCVPLEVQDTVLGVLYVSSQVSARTFTEHELDLLRAIAANSAMAIHNARQLKQIQEKRAIEHELSIAHRIQQGFYPEGVPDMKGLRVCGTCQAAKEVGGDFFDIIPLADGRVALALGDVSGKSVSAALYMAVARTALRMAIGHGQSPKLCLVEVNARIAADIQDGSFITCFLGIYDPRAKTFTYASAGHHLSLLLREADAAALSARGLPLGMDPDAFAMAIEERVLGVHAGDRLVLFTDGVIEALSPQEEEFGEAKLLAALAAAAHGRPERSVETVIGAIERHVADASPFDDMTLLVADIVSS